MKIAHKLIFLFLCVLLLPTQVASAQQPSWKSRWLTSTTTDLCSIRASTMCRCASHRPPQPRWWRSSQVIPTRVDSAWWPIALWLATMRESFVSIVWLAKFSWLGRTFFRDAISRIIDSTFPPSMAVDWERRKTLKFSLALSMHRRGRQFSRRRDTTLPSRRTQRRIQLLALSRQRQAVQVSFELDRHLNEPILSVWLRSILRFFFSLLVLDSHPIFEANPLPSSLLVVWVEEVEHFSPTSSASLLFSPQFMRFANEIELEGKAEKSQKWANLISHCKSDSSGRERWRENPIKSGTLRLKRH